MIQRMKNADGFPTQLYYNKLCAVPGQDAWRTKQDRNANSIPNSALYWVTSMRGAGYVLHGAVKPRHVPPVLDRDGECIQHGAGFGKALLCLGEPGVAPGTPLYSVSGYDDWTWSGVRFWLTLFPNERGDLRSAGAA